MAKEIEVKLERRTKENLLDIVRYEIEMLDYAFEWLKKKGKDSDPESSVYLESFLVHYRNLVHFFDKGASRKELSLRKSIQWREEPLERTVLEAVQKKAEGLYGRYSKDISSYMAHCSPQRSKIPYRWAVSEMYRAMVQVIEEFEKACSANKRARLEGWGAEVSLGTPTVRKFNLLTELHTVPSMYKPRK